MSEEPSPRWIHKVQVLRIHELQLERHGGLPGLRDNGLLESALSRPQNYYTYEEERDVFVFSALYSEGIAKNHAFLDGNKRTAHATAALFLRVSGYDLEPGDAPTRIAFFEDLADGNVTLEELTAFYRENTVLIDG